MLKNFRFITSVRPIVHDTYKTAKINFINSGAVDTIRNVYYIHGAELMKLIFAVLYVSWTMRLTLVIKRKFFNIYYVITSSISGAELFWPNLVVLPRAIITKLVCSYANFDWIWLGGEFPANTWNITSLWLL